MDYRGGSDPQQWLKELDLTVPRDQDLVLICRSGHGTGLVCEFLLEAFSGRNLYNVSDGMLGWLAAGLATAPFQSKYPTDITPEMSFSNTVIIL